MVQKTPFQSVVKVTATHRQPPFTQKMRYVKIRVRAEEALPDVSSCNWKKETPSGWFHGAREMVQFPWDPEYSTGGLSPNFP